MRTILILSITAFISHVFAVESQQKWRPSAQLWGSSQQQGGAHQQQAGPPQQQWGSPEQQGFSPQQQLWGQPQQQQGGPSQHQWGQPEQQQWGSPQQQWGYPEPENQCPCIPQNVKTTEVTPILEINVDYDSVFLCDTTSVVRQILHQAENQASMVTCNGIIVNQEERSFDLVFAEPSYGGKQKERVTISNYTRASYVNNGNINGAHCGIIANGRCAGDSIWGVRVALADDQGGCCKSGINGNIATYTLQEIKGKCESRCTLGRSTHAYAEPVNNRGLGTRNVEREQTTPKPEEPEILTTSK